MMRKIILITIILSFILCSSNALAEIKTSEEKTAETKTFIREYTYQAGEADSKLTSRAISLEQVKRLLLEELGTYLESHTEVENLQITKDQIITLSAGIVQTIILDEYWDGKIYWMKAKIEADPEKVIADLDNLRKDRKKAQEFEELKKRADDALIEIKRLKEQLIAKEDDKARLNIANQIRQETNILTAKDWVEKGDFLFMAEDYERAIEAFSKAIENDPKYATAYQYRAIAYSAIGFNELALVDINRFIKLKPKSKRSILSTLGGIYEGQKKYQKAIETFNEYIKLYPNESLGYSRLGGIYVELGDFKKAIFYYSKAVKLEPDDFHIYFNRGNIYLATYNYGQALDDYNKAIELNPTIGDFYFNRALVFLKLNNYQQAINDYTKLIEIDPTNATAYFNRGAAYGELDNHKQAIKDFTKVIELEPNDPSVYFNRARAYLLSDHQKYQEEASRDLKQAARLGHKGAQELLMEKGVTW